MHTIKTETANTYELKTGDVVMAHGHMFQLGARQFRERDGSVDVVWFQTIELFAPLRRAAGIPRHWIEREGGWIIQGNDRAHWARVVH